GGQAVRVPGERDARATADAGGLEGQAAVRIVAQGEHRVRLHGRRAAGLPGDGVAAHPIGLGAGDVAVRGSAGADGEHVRVRIVAEEHVRARARHGEGDVRAVRCAVGAVVLVPALVDRHLRLIVAGRQGVGGEGVDAVAVRVLEPGAQAVRLPVVRATQLGLEAAGYGGDDGGLVVGDPVGAVVEIELHRLGGGEVERDVGAVELGVQAIVHVPRIVERRLVLPVAGRDVEGALPDAVGVVEA